MKVIKNIIIYIFPLLIWGLYLYSSPSPDTSYTLNFFDLILLFLLLPFVYGVYNSLSKTKREWAMKCLVFIIIHALGCWLNDFVYIYDLFGNHYLGITYRSVDFFVVHLIRIDVFILLVVCLAKKIIILNRRKNNL